MGEKRRHETPRVFRATVLVWLVLWAFVGSAGERAGDEPEFRFDIPRQRADIALTTFARQADITLIFAFDKAAAVYANALSGSYTIEQALDQLLSNTGLEVRLGAPRARPGAAVEKKGDGGDMKTVRIGFFSALFGLAGSGALAQDGQEQAGQTARLDEILVTATRRTSDLQLTPISVSALDAGLIDRAVPRNLGDLAAFIPNFSAATITGFNAASFAMRGLGLTTINLFSEAPVSVLVDDFVIPSVQTQLLDTFDVEQIEVLRGPQGTLFGKNTTGGVVTLRTKRPVLDEFSSNFRASVGSYGSRQLQGAFNLPLQEDSLAARLVIGHETSDGYYRNGACYGPVVAFVPSEFAGVETCGDDRRLGGKEVVTARAKLLWEPNDSISAHLQYELLRDSSDTMPAVNETPPGGAFLLNILGVGASSTLGSRDVLHNAAVTDRNDALLGMERGHRVDVDGVYLNLDFEFGPGVVTSVSGYRKQRSRLPSSFTGQAPVSPEGNVLSLFDATRDDDRETYQQEIRFASDFDGPFGFVAGAFYQRDEIDYCVNQILGFLDLVGPPTPFGPWNDTPYIICSAQKAESRALFAEGTWSIADAWTLTAGLRNTWEKKDWRGRQQEFIPLLRGNGVDPSLELRTTLDASVHNFPANTVDLRDTVNEPTWRASIGYEVTDDLFGYLSYSRGFKAGNFNDVAGGFAPFTSPQTGEIDFDAFRLAAAATRPERADSYEIGVKSEWFERRLRLNLSAFYVEYRDMHKQINIPIEVGGLPNQVNAFFNAAKAEVKGVEGEILGAFVGGLTLRGVFGYQSGKYKEFITPVPAGYDLSTAPLDRTPKWQASLDALYEVQLSDSLMLSLNGNIAYTGRNLFTQSITDPDENTFLESRSLLNASVTLSDIDDRWFVRVIGRNVTDKRYRTASQVVGGLWAWTQFGPPRYYGLQAGWRFGGTD